MLDKLIKLANDMDARGLTSEANKLDAIILRLAEEKKLMSKDELIEFLFGPESVEVEGNIIETKEPFVQGASQCMLSEQCVYMTSEKEIHITDENGNKYKIFEEIPMDPTSKIKIEMILLN